MSKSFSVQNAPRNESSQASLACPSDNTSITMKMIMDHWRNNTDMGNRSTLTTACPTATLSTTNLIQPDMVLKPGIRGERPAIEDRLSATFYIYIYTHIHTHTHTHHREQCV